MERVEADAESVGDPGPKRLDHHVGVIGETVQRLDPPRIVREVDGDGSA